MKSTAKFLMGLGLSASASYVWTQIPNSNTFAYNPLAFFEHYHWGIASMIVAKDLKLAKPYKPYLNGFGAGMVIIEAVSTQPFGFGKPPEQSVPSVFLGMGLIATLLLL